MLTELLLQRPTLSSLLYPGQVQAKPAVSQPSSVDSSTPAATSSAAQSQSPSAAFALDLSSSALALSRSRPALLGEAQNTEFKAPSLDGEPEEAAESLNGDKDAKSATENGGKAPSGKTGEASQSAPGEEALSEEDQRKVDELENIDRKVKVHEHTHLAAAGGYARGGAQFQYVSGPDGDRYAVAGHVNMDTGREDSPEATLRKAQTVRKAALAPADPSSADRQIAANMAQMAEEARSQIAEEARSQIASGTKASSEGSTNPESSEDSQSTEASSKEPSSEKTSASDVSKEGKEGEAPRPGSSSTSQLRRDGAPWGAAAYRAASQSAYAQGTGYAQAAVSYESIALVA